MALEIEGTLAQKLPVQSGSSARGPWAKQEFVLEFPDGNFTAKACFTAWGQEKVQDLDKYQVGDKVKVRSGRSLPPATSSLPLRPGPLRRPRPRFSHRRLRLPPSRICPPIRRGRRTFRSRITELTISSGADPNRVGSFFFENGWKIKQLL